MSVLNLTVVVRNAKVEVQKRKKENNFFNHASCCLSERVGEKMKFSSFINMYVFYYDVRIDFGGKGDSWEE